MKKINGNEWKDFLINELFITEIKNKKAQVPTGAYVKKQYLKDGKIPRITVTGVNNGVYGYYDNIENKNFKTYKNFISVSFLGTVFYQKKETSLDMKVHCLKPYNIELNDNVGLFLVTAIRKSLKNCNYADQISSTLLPKLSIKLPVDNKGNPDFQYMDSYIKTLEGKTKKSLKNLISITKVKPKILRQGWKKYNLIDLFDPVLASGDLQAKNLSEGDIPLISSGVGMGNGVCKFISNQSDKSELWAAKTITVDMFGRAFYQSKPFYAVSHGRVNILIPKFEINQNIALFIISVLEKSFYNKYFFNEMCSQSALKKETISLPVKSDGNIDFNYMENYIKILKQNIIDNLDQMFYVI